MNGNFGFDKFMKTLKILSIIFSDIILLGITIYTLLYFFEFIPQTDSQSITILSVITIVLLLYVFFNSGTKYGMSAALLAYLILTQFGMSTIYYIFGPEALSSFSSTTLNFLNSQLYGKAIIIGLLATISFVYGSRLGSKLKHKREEKTRYIADNEYKTVYYIGLLFLSITLMYLLFFVLTGRIQIGMSYHAFLNSGIVNSLYSWILLMYSAGICFTVSVAEKSKLRLPIFLFGISALIFFTTGNRGEVLYATLAAMGIIYYKNEKLKFKYIFIAAVLVFILIPFIRTTRHIGTISALDLLTVNLFDPFAEMGHQLRLSVLILEEFASGTREFLYGFSYYNPIVNILDNFVPWSMRLTPPVDFNFDTAYSGLGFSQVAESYANFGIAGVIGFHSLIAFILRKVEVSNLRGRKLAFWGTVLAILINATRNRFAFVFGQLFIVIIIFLIIKLLSNTKIRIKKGN